MRNSGIIFMLIGLLFGFLVATQANSEISGTSRFFGDEITARDELIKDYLDEQSYLTSRIVALRKQIDETQDEIESQSETVNLDLLENLKRQVGLTEVSGTGVEVVLNDSAQALREGAEVTDSLLVQASDIRDVVNVLNTANVEAISINGQRVLASSPISSVGTTILVNNAYIAPPFTVSAVGDTEIILQRLSNRSVLSSLYERSDRGEILMDFYAKNQTTIPLYNADFKANYLTLISQ